MHLFFDLDGTLTDSSPGIIRCINHALGAMAVPTVPEAHLRPMIGTPLFTIFETLLDTADQAVVDDAVAHFRERFNTTGIFENAVYPGVVEALASLCAAGHHLQLVTAKPAVSARRVLDHFALAPYFAAVHGPALSDRGRDKADFVAAALDTVEWAPGQVVMIGDRVDDVRAARRHQVRAVAAGWGYGTAEELHAAEPEYVAGTMADVVAWVELHASGPAAGSIR